jgi:dTDP-4-amino-4,6-dideoxygalactose transaminase
MLSGREFEYMREALASGHISGDGVYTVRASKILRELTEAAAVLLTTSCTHALELCALLLDLRPGDEFVVPSFTFVSTANAFALRGATPVFVDIRPDTLNIDETQLCTRLSSRTKAVIVVHYGGVGAEMDEISAIVDDAGVSLVEDNAHGLFGRYRGQPLGSFGSLAALSFHETKNVHCGEGGALLVNDEALLPRAEVIREKGTNRSEFLRGETDKYTWVGLGSSYLPSDLLAAFLTAQLEAADRLQERRKSLWNRYYAELKDWACSLGVGLPFVPDHCDHPAHLFYLLMRSFEDRQNFIAHLAACQIHSVFHYVPLHSSPEGTRLGGRAYECPVTDDVSARLVRLPLYPSLTDEEQARVIESVHRFPREGSP